MTIVLVDRAYVELSLPQLDYDYSVRQLNVSDLKSIQNMELERSSKESEPVKKFAKCDKQMSSKSDKSFGAQCDIIRDKRQKWRPHLWFLWLNHVSKLTADFAKYFWRQTRS